MKIILASGSPRRRELLEQMELEFTVEPADGEQRPDETDPVKFVEKLAFEKAKNVAEKHRKDAAEFTVIGADTVVVFHGKILGKPADEAAAVSMLSLLSGRTHQVYTGTAVLVRREDCRQSRIFSECTDVTFYPLTREEISDYVKSGDPMDKAGAYGIQTKGGLFVQKIDGDYYNVVGLPIARLYQELRKLQIL